MSIQVTQRKDGTFVGYDYDNQLWIDTGDIDREYHCKPGSAWNPLDYVPEGAEVTKDTEAK